MKGSRLLSQGTSATSLAGIVKQTLLDNEQERENQYFACLSAEKKTYESPYLEIMDEEQEGDFWCD